MCLIIIKVTRLLYFTLILFHAILRATHTSNKVNKRKCQSKTEPRLPGSTVKLFGNHLFHALRLNIKNTQTHTEQIVSFQDKIRYFDGENDQVFLYIKDVPSPF